MVLRLDKRAVWGYHVLMRQDVAEYLTLAYKGELAIRDADHGKVNKWAKDTTKLLVERLKDQLGTADKPIYTTNIIGQIKEKKRPSKIPDVISKYIGNLGGKFDEKTFEYTLPENISFEQALNGAKVLMARAFDFHMYPKALWMMASIATGLITLVCAYVVWLKIDDYINLGIFIGMLFLFAAFAWKTVKYEKFPDVAAKVRERVIRSKSMPE